jgi:aspartyl-tRNA(Asn)/glutamyl-tRNA(Gln) amidotransferase subunit B
LVEEGWEAVIGLECHVQLRTVSKIFSASSAAFGAPPNSEIDPVCLGLPGVLPVLNRRAVEFALRMALATGCRIRQRCRFARKHYFYPDLPKGFQISQYDEPVAEGGHVTFQLGGATRSVRLTRIHLEEDAGKNLHAPGGGAVSLVDFNRAGVPLIEVVSEPDLRSAAEAAEYLRALRQLVRWLDICDGNMEEGSLRCDANVSVRPAGARELGTKAELKNINSFKFVEEAIEYEIARQVGVLRRGERVVQETRLWDSERKSSQAMRSKEEAHDYRYFPEPDLPPLAIDDAWVDRVRAELPELPLARRARFAAAYDLGDHDAALLTSERDLADYFEAVVTAGAPAKKAANWIQTEVLARPGARERLPPAALAELVRLIEDGTMSGRIAKEVFEKMLAGGETARAIVEREGLSQVSDAAAIAEACRAVIAQSPRQVEQYRAGRAQVLGFFVGQVMKQMQGRANPALVNEILKQLLGASE